MAFGFQRDDLQYGSSPFGVGTGAAGFGTQPFGGGGYEGYEPPTLQQGSDDPTTDLVSSVAESVLTRDGVPIAARVWAERRTWRFVYHALPLSDIEALRAFWRVRRFRLLPDSMDEGTYWIVRWNDRTFEPQRLRGGQERFNLQFDLVEVP
jgi:hypothetical protein